MARTKRIPPEPRHADTHTLAHTLSQTGDRQRLLNTPLVAVIDALPEAVFIYALDSSIAAANTVARTLFGLDADSGFADLPYAERLARTAPRDLRGRPLPKDAWHIPRVLAGDVVTSDAPVEMCITTLDRRELTMSYTAAPIRDASGAIIGAISLGRDITEQRRMEREAALGATQMIAAFESMTDGVVVFGLSDGENPHMRPVHMNAANYALFGLEPGRLDVAQIELYDEHGRLLPEEEWPYQRILHGETVRGGNAIDMVIGGTDGRHLQVNVSGAPIRDADGRIVGGVIVHRDVTERRQLERRTQEALEALLALAELVVASDMSTSASAPASRAEEVGNIDALGERLVRMTTRVLGCSRAALSAVRHRGGPLEPVAVVGLSPEHERTWKAGQPRGAFLRDGMPSWLTERLQNGEAIVLDYTQPPMSERPNPLGLRQVLFVALRVGHEVVGILNADYGSALHAYTPEELRLAEAVAKLLGLVVERDRLLRERAAAQAQALALAEINRRMDEFLSIASHELKTPVTVIKANLQLLARHEARGADTRQRLPAPTRGETERRQDAERQDSQMIERALVHVERLTRLVNDMLDVSRVREGKLEFRLESVDLSSIVADMVEGQRQSHPARSISLAIESAETESPLLVVADADRIGQVVTNYLTNALKYSREGQPVEVALRREGDTVRVSVRDHGVGIPATEQEHVWEPFRRAEGIEVQSGSGVGLGLGLYICRTIVERHGGQVGVESEVGRGSTFSFTLPLSPMPAAADSPERTP